MNISLVLSPYPSYVGSIKVAIFEAANPGAEVQSQTFAAPHTSPRAVSFTGVDKVVHIVKTIALTGPTTLHDFTYQPLDTDYIIYTPIFFRVGDGGTYTPAPGTTEYRNPDLAGLDFWVERRGMGSLVDVVEVTKVSADPDFGFDLAIVGDEFVEDDRFTIHILPKKIITPVNESVAGKWYDSTVEVTATRSYLTTDLKKMILLRGSGASITYTLPAPSLAPIGYIFSFQTFGSLWTVHVIASPSANIKDKTGASVNQLEIGANQYLHLVFNGVSWEIVVASDILGFAISNNPDENNSAKVASTVATSVLAGRIKTLASGKFTVGDVPGGDTTFSASFPNPSNADYIVMGSWKSNGTHAFDNSLFWAWWKDETTPNTKFKISVQELAAEVQNVEFCWMVIKI